ncbi:PaaI family thioesterase [Paracoccus sp. YIM 132242]|uniref:PaaI family thioesterase n=1 Tax=Paracoccus lichenicola TaxID=2665644 RepID=A0A6L6HWN8_9RHOB|nr:PaaI family thioesterase [Paracoccus lichenicola]MTE01738.1 PaaI family thioesterase [Paracoccus lichenicola]
MDEQPIPVQAEEADDPPSGFVPLADCAESERLAGPYYVRLDRDAPAIGFRVKRRHLNRAGMCHGGVLATLADMNITPISRYQELAEVNPTISMTLDYFAPVVLGQWVEAQPTILRRTRNILFSQCVLTADGAPSVRASVVYRIGRPR